MFFLSTFKTNQAFLKAIGVWQQFTNAVDHFARRGFNETLQGISVPSIFQRLSSVVKNRLEGIFDVTCINVALPGLICLPRLLYHLLLQFHNIILSFCLNLWPSFLSCNLSRSAALPLCDSAYQGAVAGSELLQTPGKFHARA